MSLPKAVMPPVTSGAQTGSVGFLPFTPPDRARPHQSYTSDDIRNFVLSKGWANPDGVVTNPRAIYEEARRRGIGAPQLDQAGGWAPGTANAYTRSQGWGGLGQQGDARVGPVPTLGQSPAAGQPPVTPQPMTQPMPQLGPAPEHAALADAMIAQRSPGPNRGQVTPAPQQPAFAQTGQGVAAAGKPQTYFSSGYYDPYAPR